MISKMIQDEKPVKPLSDDAIAKNISKRGVKLARRTVAKYREILNIPSSSERRRKAKMEMTLSWYLRSMSIILFTFYLMIYPLKLLLLL